MTIPIYEGNLPPAVARDFEFAHVISVRGEAYPLLFARRYDSPKLIPLSAYNELKNRALDSARLNLAKLLGKLDQEGTPISLVADVRVQREIKTSKFTDGTYYPEYQLIIEAIGYKRRERKEE